jgi:hypothetical protein
MLFFLRAITVLLAAKSRPGNFISFFPKYFVMTGSSRF